MTNSVKTRLCLTKLSRAARLKVPLKVCHVTNSRGELVERHFVATVQPNPMCSDSFLHWLVRPTAAPWDAEELRLAEHIDADLNLPEAFVYQNLEHGTSVFAAGVATLELARIWLLECGLPREELDLLTTDDVTLRGGTGVTYLIPCESPHAAQALLDQIDDVRRLLYPHTRRDTVDNSVTIPGGAFSVKAFINRREYWVPPDGIPTSYLMDRALCFVRLEVTLDEYSLQTLRLVSLDAWRHGYALGLYEDIFDGTVRNALHLDDDQPCTEILALAGNLSYPGDYHPSREHEVWCVCRATWADHLRELRKFYLHGSWGAPAGACR